jgi:hypothetical protein
MPVGGGVGGRAKKRESHESTSKPHRGLSIVFRLMTTATAWFLDVGQFSNKYTKQTNKANKPTSKSSKTL